jgi:hypothetical protein
MTAMGLSGVLWLLAALIVLGGLLYFFRRRTIAVKAHDNLQAAADDPARALFAAAGGEPPTEDQIAQARLGGTRGDPSLGAAPMVRQEAENTPRHIDDGHVA